MNKPNIVDRDPIKVAVKEGETHYWCACGLSKSQPYCDGSHSSTDITPMKFVTKDSGAAYLCMCKHTQNAPYCDGSHAKLD